MVGWKEPMSIPRGASRFHVLGFTLAAALSAGTVATAQEPGRVSAPGAPRLSVTRQADGRLNVEASDTPVNEVIRAVAATAGMDIASFGNAPREPVTVVFAGESASDILT